MSKDVIKFTHDGKEYLVRKPNVQDSNKAQEKANLAFNLALKSGALLRSELNDELEKRKLWSSEKENEYQKLRKELDEAVKQLQKGGSLKGGKEVALKIRALRVQQRAMIMPRLTLDSMTAEGQSENAKFNALAASCILSSDKKPVFADYEDYLNRSNEEVAALGAGHLASLVYGYDESHEQNLPENKFLVKYKMADEKGRLINEAKHLIDEEGRLINEDGRFIQYTEENGVRVPVLVDGKNVFVDRDNNPIEEEVVFGVFTDDNGNVVE